MVEADKSSQLSELLEAEKDWSRAAIFTDSKQVIANRNCNVLEDEIE